MPFLAPIEHLIEGSLPLSFLVIVIAFAVLAKCADLFVDSAVGLAWHLKVPKLVIGIVLVSLATTAPELTVSLMAAIRGNPEMALGNAVGSVIADDGLALGLAGIVSAAPILVLPAVLHSSGIFLITVMVTLFLFVVRDQTLDRWQGAVLVAMFAGYLVYMFRQHRAGKFADDPSLEEVEPPAGVKLPMLILLFAGGLVGIIIASELIVTSATTIALAAGVPEAVVALTLIALGTSIPEVATCVAAARKKEGDIAVGNILGADILNICWVAGASAMANSLKLGVREILFMFPTMFVVVGTMLIMLRHNYRLTRTKGIVLLALYVLYICGAGYFFIFSS